MQANEEVIPELPHDRGRVSHTDRFTPCLEKREDAGHVRQRRPPDITREAPNVPSLHNPRDGAGLGNDRPGAPSRVTHCLAAEYVAGIFVAGPERTPSHVRRDPQLHLTTLTVELRPAEGFKNIGRVLDYDYHAGLPRIESENVSIVSL